MDGGYVMILSEKIMSLRKRAGWSQEELGNKLNVSRQSVSKWESAAAIPDITKIVQLSELFGVSTDYLLKDDVPDNQVALLAGVNPADDGSEIQIAPGRPVTLEEAGEYMDLVQKESHDIALGVALCIWSSILLILLDELAEIGILRTAKEVPDTVGLTVLLIMVAAAVFIFVVKGQKTEKFDFLDTDEISLQYGVEAAVMRRRESFENTYRLSVAAGVILIIVGIIPVVILGAFENVIPDASAFGVCLLLLAVGCAVYLFVKNRMVNESYEKLLQEDSYTPENKAAGKRISWFPGAYWGTATAVYLGWSFISRSWERTWIVWPIAGVTFGVLYGLLIAAAKRK